MTDHSEFAWLSTERLREPEWPAMEAQKVAEGYTGRNLDCAEIGITLVSNLPAGSVKYVLGYADGRQKGKMQSMDL